MIKIEHLKTKHTETFKDWKQFYAWATEVLEREVWESWQVLEKFERRGYDNHWEWFKDLALRETDDWLWDYGYNLIVETNKQIEVEKLQCIQQT